MSGREGERLARAAATTPSDLEHLLGRLLEEARVPSDVEGTVRVHLAPDLEWTIRLGDGRAAIADGSRNGVTTTIRTDAETFRRILEGRASPIRAFLDDRLRVRGNLALALRLEGFLPFPPGSVPRSREGTVTAAGVPTFYLEAGSGPPVVLLHGLGATIASLLPLYWDLVGDHRVIVPDLPGFGESGKPMRSYDAAFYAGWLREFLDEVDADRASLVGNSMGGRVALEAALEFPNRVDRIALLAPSMAFIKRREFVRLVRILRPELALVPLPLRHRRVVRSIQSMFSRPSRLPDAWYEAAADEFLRVFATVRGRIAFFSAARQIYLEEPWGDTGFWTRLSSLSRPALFLWGERDRLVPAGFSRHAERAVPNARSVILDDCGHVPQFELRERTTALVREFLQGSP